MQGNRSAPPVVMTGTVLWFDDARGYGFVRLDCLCGTAATRNPLCAACGATLDDVFTHYSSIADGRPGKRTLLQDQRVKILYKHGDKGLHAVSVEVTI
jgi:cold shock CspA family protein